MTTPRFLLVGAASELSLRPLAAALTRRGLPVAVIDLVQEPVTASAAPPGGGPLVLVTSQHLAMTGAVYDRYSAISTHVVSPQALKVSVGADLLVYVPHDLVDPVLPAEVPLLQLLDLFVAPDHTSWWVAAHAPTVVAGWVGATGVGTVSVPQAVADRGILFISSVRWVISNGGGPYLLQSLRRTLEYGLAAKLPDWPGLHELEDALVGAGVDVLDPRTPASDLIAGAPLVVSNAAGSVIAEASLAGHRPVCVLGAGGPAQFGPELAAFDVEVCDDDGFGVAASRAGRIRPDAVAFDVDLFLSAVGAQLGARRA